MTIRQLKMNNFAIYLGEQTIDLADPIQTNKPITLIGGFNGRGKTTLLDAILLALYGNRSPRITRGLSYSNYLLGLINSNADVVSEETFVELTIDMSDGQRSTMLRVRRTWPQKPNRIRDTLEVWQDGVINPYLADGWDAYIEEQIPLAIAELFFFDAEKISALAESEETVESLQRAIRTLLGVETIEQLIRNLRSIVRSKEAQIKNEESYQALVESQGKHDNLEEQLIYIKQQMASLQAKKDQTLNNLQELNSRYYGSGGHIYEHREQDMERHQYLTKHNEELRSALIAHASGVLPIALLSQQLPGLLVQLRAEEKAKRAKYIIPEIDQLREILLQSPSIHGTDVATLIDETICNQYGPLEQLADQQIHHTLLPIQLEQILFNIPEEIGIVRALLIEMERCKKEIVQLESNLSVDLDAQKFKVLANQRAALSRDLEEIDQSMAAFEDNSKKVKMELWRLEAQIGSIGVHMAETVEAERIIKFALEGQVKMRSFSDRLIKRKVGILSGLIKERLEILLHKNSLIRDVDVNPNSFKITLMNAQGQVISKTRLSAGERQMFAIAILWGLATASGKDIPVLIDTPMGRLDSLHRSSFVERYLPKASHQVVILSTDTEISGGYLDLLRPHIGRSYILEYVEPGNYTKILDGYFEDHQREEVTR